MRILFSIMVATMLGLPVFAADSSAEAKSSSDTSVNPITGTKKTTRKYKRKTRLNDGSESSANVTKTTKEKTDGTVEHKIDAKKVEDPAN